MTLYLETPCEHGKAGLCLAMVGTHKPACPGGVRREVTIDYEAAWDVYYHLADRRHKDGLTALQVRAVVDVALGVSETMSDYRGADVE